MPAETTPEGDPVVVYYSRTGTTHAVATDVADGFASPAVHRIRPHTGRSYPNWLARSFVPGSTVPIEPAPTDLREADAVVLGTPKWTLSCPPVTEFLRRADLAGVPVGLVLTYGGFDEQRYADALVDRLAGMGADVRATLLVKRDEVGGSGYGDRLREFRERLPAPSEG
jgi:hypothetical protein